ncbi:MAG: hypothetical protein ACTSRI_09040 [Promethearchaeota archaeon]
MNNNIEDEYYKIIEYYSNAIIDDNCISHIKIPLKDNFFLKINFDKYPKNPIVYLISKYGRASRKLNKIIPMLKNWEKKTPPSIIELINQILIFFKNLESREISIKKDFLYGIFALCKNQHPKEILGLLRTVNGVASEYILPPGAFTSTNSGVFFPSRLGFDPTLEGTIHSHPSGNPNPSLVDINNVFKTKKFNFIIAYPYNMSSIKCFNNRGKEIKFKIIN